MKYTGWVSLQAQALMISKVEQQAKNRIKVSFLLLDVLKQTPLAGLEYDSTPAQLRGIAHKIADVIYEKMTGEKGVFDTRITYVAKQGNRFQLQVADADGNKLAYVSFEKKTSHFRAVAGDGATTGTGQSQG